MSEPFTWHLIHFDKPWLMNHDNNLHYRERANLRMVWKNAFWGLAKQAKIPKLDHVRLSIIHHYSDRRYVPDCDACAPAVKAAIDGIRIAGVISDDGPQWVGPITYELPVKSLRNALEVVVTATVQPH